MSVQVFAQKRDSFFINRIHLAGNEVSAVEMGLSAPPIPIGRLLLMNSISGNQWQLDDARNLPDTQIYFSKYSYSAFLVYPVDKDKSFTLGESFGFSALGPTARLSRDANFNTTFFSFSSVADDNKNIRWSVGLVVLDRSNANRLFPLAGISYSTEDQKWRFSLGFPTISITYSPESFIDLGVFVARESSKYLIPEDHALAPNGKYLEQNQSMYGVSAQFILPAGFKLNFKVARLVDSKYRFLNSGFSETSPIKDYGDLSYLSMGLAWSFTPPKQP